MICNTFRRENFAGFTYYYPLLKDNIHCEQFKRERGRLGFEVPREVKCKKALPSFSYIKKEFSQKLSIESQFIATSLVELFITEISGGFLEVICAEIEGGKYLKFQFQYFYTFDFMNIPIVVYKPIAVISKKAAKKYLVCLDQE